MRMENYLIDYGKDACPFCDVGKVNWGFIPTPQLILEFEKMKIKYLGMFYLQKFRFHVFMDQLFLRNHYEIHNSLKLILKE